jgi:hypothetical protein
MPYTCHFEVSALVLSLNRVRSGAVRAMINSEEFHVTMTLSRKSTKKATAKSRKPAGKSAAKRVFFFGTGSSSSAARARAWPT